MATAAKFVQPIPIFLAYRVPLVVDVVPIKFHQFLILLLSFFLSFFFSSAKSLSDTFLGDYRTEINETSQEC
jgi:hypothetical protein